MLILICPVCKSSMQVLGTTKEGENGFKCFNEMCPSYGEVVPFKDINEDCLEIKPYIQQEEQKCSL